MTTASLLSEWRKTLLAEQMVVMMEVTIQPEEGINKLQKDSVETWKGEIKHYTRVQLSWKKARKTNTFSH